MDHSQTVSTVKGQSARYPMARPVTGAVKNGHASGSTAFIPTKVGHRKRDQLLQKGSMTLKEELCEAKISKVAS